MSGQSFVSRADAALHAGDRERALSLLHQALVADAHDVDALIALAKITQAEGQLEQARQFAARAVHAESDNLSAWILRAELDHAVGDSAAALAAFQTARKLASDNKILPSKIGAVHYARGEFEESAQAYAQALKLDPANDVARRNGIMAVAGTGNVEATAAQCEAYLADKRGRFPCAAPPALPADEAHTTRFKLEHDREQILYLLGHGALDDSFIIVAEALGEAIADLYGADADTRVVRGDMGGEHWRLLERAYNRPVHVPADAAVPQPLINPDLDIGAIEARYRESVAHIVWIDELLAPDALGALREFLYRATIWYDIRPNCLTAGFIEGFANRLTLGIAEDLRKALPGVFGDHRLTQSWACRYGSRLSGRPVHVDAAAVNVKFWTAPPHANLDPTGGGLKVYTSNAPPDWDVERFGNDQKVIKALLSERGAAHVTIPHACNRAAIFDSSLFHETDRIRFVDEYQSRRTSVTMLYGLRGTT